MPEPKMKLTNVRLRPEVKAQDPATFSRFQFVGPKAEHLAQFGLIAPQQVIRVSDEVAAALTRNDPLHYKLLPRVAAPVAMARAGPLTVPAAAPPP